MSWIYFFMFCLFGAFNLFVIFIAYEEEAMQLDSLANVDTYWNVGWSPFVHHCSQCQYDF